MACEAKCERGWVYAETTAVRCWDGCPDGRQRSELEVVTVDLADEGLGEALLAANLTVAGVPALLRVLRAHAIPAPAPLDLLEALAPFAEPGGGWDMQAFHDMEDDEVVWENSGQLVTVGDVRRARLVLGKHTGVPVSEMHARGRRPER